MTPLSRKAINLAITGAAAGADQPPPRLHSPDRPRWLQLPGDNSFVWHQFSLPIERLPEALRGLRIVHLSDFHMGARWHGGYDRLAARFQNDPPDLLLITGDFLDYAADPRPALPVLRRLMKTLTSRLGTYAILGNHDSDLLMPPMASLNITLISGRRVLLSDPRAAIELIGLPGLSRADLDGEFLQRLPPRVAGTPRIVLSHFPELFVASQALDADLFLAGHTHGGQICLPGGWPLMRHNTMPRRFSRGIHRLGRSWYVVSRGFGVTGIPMRLFCPAEAMQITLDTTDPAAPQ